MKWRVRKEEEHFADKTSERLIGGVYWVIEPKSWLIRLFAFVVLFDVYRPHRNKEDAIEECRKLKYVL